MVVLVMTSASLFAQSVGPNLIVNPSFQNSNQPGCANVTNIMDPICYPGWDDVSGTPNTLPSGNLLFIWSRACDQTSEAIIGSLSTPLVQNKQYRIQITYQPYYLFGSYPGIVYKAYCQFTRSNAYIKANGAESSAIRVSSDERIKSKSMLVRSVGDSASFSNFSDAFSTNMPADFNSTSSSCVEPTAKFPDLVNIGGSLTDKVWAVQDVTDYLNWKTDQIDFVATEASTNFIFSILSSSVKVPHGIRIKDIFISEVLCSVTPTIDITAQNMSCATKFNPTISFPNSNCNVLGYTWDFGNGIIRVEKSPVFVIQSSGQNVSLLLRYRCESCDGVSSSTKFFNASSGSVFIENLAIEVQTDQRQKILTASASTFSDSWPLPHDNSALRDKNSFINGAQGVWRNDATYVYDSPRQLSVPTNLAQDGTFTLNHFDWGSAEFNIVPNWIRANTMTQYSPYSYELENRDVLGVYSAALYDYGGHLPSANGVNMRYTEMAFTSFEVNDGKPTGNWMFNNAAQPASMLYKVPVGSGHLVVVDAPVSEFDAVSKVDVSAQAISFFGFFISGKSTTFLQGVDVLCKQAHPSDPKRSILVLSRAPFESLWFGQLTVNRVASPAVTPLLDNTVFHSGRQSLKIVGEMTFRQELLQLEAGKSYWINTWVSVNNPLAPTPVLGTNLGIEVAMKNRQGTVVGTASFQPVGQVIEGWQQVKGTFVAPANTYTLEVKFKAGSAGTAWFDDLRLQPEKGNMKAYVYDLKDYRLRAILDEENFASFFFYDAEGNLYLTKKETERGIKTITENVSYQIER